MPLVHRNQKGSELLKSMKEAVLRKNTRSADFQLVYYALSCYFEA